MAGKRKKVDAPAGAPAWMMTYGDLVTQMLTFFILLFTFSTLDTIKFRDAVISLQGAFGVLSGGTQILNLSDMPTSAPVNPESSPMSNPRLVEVKNILDELIQDETDQNIKEQIEKLSQESVSEQTTKEDEANVENIPIETESLITTILDEHGLRIRFSDSVLFALGKANLKPEAVDILTGIADVLSSLPNLIIIEGHTDNVPIHTSQFKSNWELSTARACEVLHFLIQEGGVNPVNLAASGYGEYHPIVPNDTVENRGRNRRVEILILNDNETVSDIP